jgi:hypothetical protein
MNTQDWQDNNTHYLSTSLEWLRLKLERFAQPYTTATPAVIALPATVSPAPPATSPSSWKQLFTSPPAPQAAIVVPPAVSATEKNVDPRDKQLADLQAELEAAAQADTPPALVLLAKRLGLTPFEQNILLLCAAMELDTRIAGLCAQAQENGNRAYPTFALALSLFDNPAWDALSPDRPLRYWQLLEINQPGAHPLTTSALRADEHIVNYLKGLDAFDDRLARFISAFPEGVAPGSTDLPPSQQASADEIVSHFRNSPSELPLPIVQLLGPDALSKELVMAHAAGALGLEFYYLPANLLPQQIGDLETLARLWQRESALRSMALFLDVQESDGSSPEHAVAVQRFISRADGVIFLGTRESWQNLGRSSFSMDISKPTTLEQQAIWERMLDGQSVAAARQLAAQFNLNRVTIDQVTQTALAGAKLEPEQIGPALWAACSSATRPRLDALAQRIQAKATWDGLVLPAEQTALLHQIAAQVGQRQTVYEDWGFAERMNRGLGISALFAGESGTGKTMAAEVIANELQLNLYRIDLSAVVSKYIGETEKNLRRLFDAAEDGGAILFFDEADALFGKRSEVKDSHDRYANIEINYLLQRIEAYRGLAILATNMKSALDPAFIRRLRFLVNFTFPGPAERKLIWQKVFPPKTPLEALDYDRLSRFSITGGNIQSIAMNAAFMAAQAGASVSMPVVLSAVRTEFRKLERPVNEAEFVWKG